MKPYTFEKAASLEDAIAARANPHAFVLAGGTDLIAQMKAGHKTPTSVVDIKSVPEMRRLETDADNALVIGAAVNATTLASNSIVRAHHGAVHDAVQLIGSLQIQNRASLGGNICNAAPSADAVPPLIVDAATALIAGPDGTRTLPLEELFTGPGRTSLAGGELLVSIALPKPAARSASAYLRFTPRREMDIAIVGVAARIDLDANDRISGARIALASVAPTPIRAPAAEAALVGAALTPDAFAAAATAAQSDASPISDTRASAEYRRELVAVLTRRALNQCASRLN